MGMYKSSDFRSETPPPRIMGSETEYLVSAPGHGSEGQSKSSAAAGRIVTTLLGGQLAAKKQRLEITGDHKSQYLLNGGRAYRDCSNFVELATPEALGPTEATNAEIAFQRNLMDYCDAYAKSGEKVKIDVFRRTGYVHNIKEDGTTLEQSSGYHQNLLTPLAISAAARRRDQLFIASYAAFRAIFLGSGIVGQDGYHWQQKACDLSPDLGSAVPRSGFGSRTRKKPIVTWSTTGLPNNDTQMQPHADGWDRLEIRYADALHSYWGRYMGFATASLALRITEQQHLLPKDFLRRITFGNIVDALSAIATDTTLTRKYQMRSEHAETVLSLNRICANAALTLADKIALPEEEIRAAHEWLRITDDMQTIDMQNPETFIKLGNRLESAARYAYICRNTGATVLNSLDFAVVQRDLTWDRISPTSHADNYWKRKGQPELFAEHELAIAALMKNPPADTRAARRVGYMQGDYDDVRWGYIELKNSRASLPDPFDYSLPLSDK